ncbi:MAG: 30S ribosomal protein S24e [Methanobacteriaceae archaeon]|jgi:small subunit ribosomal protein S24e|nr:30S ribosomal protein S24e [Methanobacteriaceae archaeon]OPY21791.1 MAG: 30S ribosomal protein S24e [Methanobacterium sp. PtaU1.Bin097]
MEINITQKTENPLLDRTEIEFDCTYQGESTPKILDVKNKLVAVLDADKNLLVVDKLKPQFGEGKAVGYAKVYDSAESLASTERKHILKKNQEPVKEEAEEEEAEAVEAEKSEEEAEE